MRLAFLVVALKNPNILSADLHNAYLNALTEEQIYMTTGPEFGPDKEGWTVMIASALYSLRSSGTRWHNNLAAMLWDSGLRSCKADTDACFQVAVRPHGGEAYCEHVLSYVDNILVISEELQALIDYLKSTYALKNGSVGEPTVYLSAKV
jgi:hypothetical protein